MSLSFWGPKSTPVDSRGSKWRLKPSPYTPDAQGVGWTWVRPTRGRHYWPSVLISTILFYFSPPPPHPLTFDILETSPGFSPWLRSSVYHLFLSLSTRIYSGGLLLYKAEEQCSQKNPKRNPCCLFKTPAAASFIDENLFSSMNEGKGILI